MDSDAQAQATQRLVDSSWKLVEPWIDTNKYDNMNEWVELFRSIMKTVQETLKVPGLVKAEIAVDTVQKLASRLLTKVEVDNPIVKLIVSEGGGKILKAATKGFKEALSSLDKDGDGEISLSECKSIFACCCPDDK